MHSFKIQICVEFRVYNTNILEVIDINIIKKSKKWLPHEYPDIIHFIDAQMQSL